MAVMKMIDTSIASYLSGRELVRVKAAAMLANKPLSATEGDRKAVRTLYIARPSSSNAKMELSSDFRIRS
eukprot:4659726-Amphidinium_carterae.2